MHRAALSLNTQPIQSCTARRIACSNGVQIASASILSLVSQRFYAKPYKKKSYRQSEAEYVNWKHNVQLNDEKYKKWSEEMQDITSNRLEDPEIISVLASLQAPQHIIENHQDTTVEASDSWRPEARLPKGFSDRLRAWATGETSQQNDGVLLIRVPSQTVIDNAVVEEKESNSLDVEDDASLPLPEAKQEASQDAMPTAATSASDEESIVLFFDNDSNGQLNTRLLQAFTHSSYVAKQAKSATFAELQALVNRHSNQELSRIGASVLDSLCTNFISFALYPASNSKLMIAAAPRYDLVPVDFTSFDLIDYQNITMDNIKQTKSNVVSHAMLVKASRLLGLPDLLLHNIEIEERPEGQEIIVVRDHEKQETEEPIGRNRAKRLQFIERFSQPKTAVFETNKDQALQSFHEIVDRQLLESLFGAIWLQYGSEYAAAFFIQKVLPLLQDELRQLDTVNYVEKLKQLLAQRKAVPEYRVDKTIIKRRKHRDIKVTVLVSGVELGHAFGETYSEAKWSAAKRVFMYLQENPIRLDNLDHLLVNKGYIHAMGKLLPPPLPEKER